MKKLKDIIPVGTETRFINCLRRYLAKHRSVPYTVLETYNLSIGNLNIINVTEFKWMSGVGKKTSDQLEDLKAKLQRFDKRNYHRLHNKNK